MGMSVVKKAILIREKNIPRRLRDYPHWLVWRYEKAEGDKPEAKMRKVPYYPSGRKRGGVLGSEADVDRLGTFQDALEAARTRGFDGVGLAILPEQDITVIDLDDCISDTGVYSDFANELIEYGSYVERSPSGRGIRAVYEGALIHDQKRNFHIDNGERVEVYCGKAYTTFTGNKLPSINLDDIHPLSKRLKRKLIAGMGQSSTAATGDGEGTSDALASMDSIALPNMTAAQAGRVLKGLPERWGASGEGTWYKVAAALHMQFDGSEEAYEVLDTWSQDRDGYDEANNRARWNAGFSHARGKQSVTSMRNLVFEARDAGVRFKQKTLESWGLARAAQEKAAEDDIELPGDEVTEEVRTAWRPIDPEGWLGAGERPAGTPMLIPHWLTDENVTLFSSSGGSGKSYIALTLLAFAADGNQTWFGMPMVKGKALFVSGEDPTKDIQSRLWGICEKYGLDRAEVAANMDIVDVASLLHKALYEAGDYGRADFTKHYAMLEGLLTGGEYKYVVLDNVSEFFAGNENSRNQVVSFVGSLKRLTIQCKLAILLLGHTAKAVESSYSGSTAWHNSTRVRWSLEEDKSDGSRKLVVERITHGERGRAGKWVWDTTHGVMAMGEECGTGSAAMEFGQSSLDEAVFDAVDLLATKTSKVPTSATGPLGAITINPGVTEILDRMGVHKDDRSTRIRQSLEGLRAAGRLLEVEYLGTNRRTRFGYETNPI